MYIHIKENQVNLIIRRYTNETISLWKISAVYRYYYCKSDKMNKNY